MFVKLFTNSRAITTCLIRQSRKDVTRKKPWFCGFCTQTPDDKHKLALFFDGEVQELLMKLTGLDVEKVFSKRKDGEKLEAPAYKFMTTEELEQARKEALKKAEKKLQMPPALPPREEEDHVFVKDERLDGYCSSKLVFTDITFGVSDRERIVVVREPDGTLRKAKNEERARVNQIYFPRPDRKILPPAMFQDPYLKSVLDRGEYMFVLERACCQYEPDDPEYIRVTERVYELINDTQSFDDFRSTRHYGPMVFYLVRNQKIDNLLLENFRTDRLEDAVWLINLYHIINPDAESKSANLKKGEELDFIKAFIDKDAKKKDVLELALRSHKDLLTSPKAEAVSGM